MYILTRPLSTPSEYPDEISDEEYAGLLEWEKKLYYEDLGARIPDDEYLESPDYCWDGFQYCLHCKAADEFY